MILAMFVLLTVVATVFTYRTLRWITTPLFKKIGLYRYYSPMMFTVPFGTNTLELHVGTTWDFFKRTDLTEQQILIHLANGLLGLIKEVEGGRLSPQTRLRGTVYYFGSKTLTRFGFTSRPMNALESIMFSMNWLELFLLRSLMKKRIATVPLSKVRIVHATVSGLIEHKADLQALLTRIQQKKQPLVTA